MNYQEGLTLARANPGAVLRRSSTNSGEWIVERKDDLPISQTSPTVEDTETGRDTETWLQKMGLREVQKPPGRDEVAEKITKDYPLRYIDEGIAGMREDNKRTRAQNLSDLRKRNY